MLEFPSNLGKLRRHAIVVIGITTFQAFLTSQAEALSGLQLITKASVLSSSTSKTVAAGCPIGKRVVGGGGAITGGRGQVVLQQLEPAQNATGDRFVVGAREDGTGYSGTWRLTAYALCANPIPGYGILPSTSGSASSNSPQSTISFCVGQTQVGLGGRINGGAGQVHLTNLARESNGTIDFARIAAREDANGFAGIWNATTFAVCASTPPNLTTVSATTPPSSAGKSATVSCPAGTRVHSAGGQLTSVRSASVDGSLVIDRVAIDPQLRSVTVRAVEDETGTSAAWSVKALALCGP